MSECRLSVVIVSFECRDALLRCLDSLRSALHEDDEVIVVDNASTDGTVQEVKARHPGVRCIANPRNVGFARAVNDAVPLARGRLTLLLNPDTTIDRGAVDGLVACLDGMPRPGIAGPRLVEDDGRTQRSAFRFPTPVQLFLEQTAVARFLPVDRPPASGSCHAAVDWLKGACVLAPTDLLRSYGPFDPGYFMFSEDVDLCRRLARDRVPVVWVPGVRVLHVGGVSTARHPVRMRSMWAASTYRYYRLHHGRLAGVSAVLVIRLTAAGKFVRAVAGWSLARFRGDPTAARWVVEIRSAVAVMRVALPSRSVEM